MTDKVKHHYRYIDVFEGSWILQCRGCGGILRVQRETGQDTLLRHNRLAIGERWCPRDKFHMHCDRDDVHSPHHWNTEHESLYRVALQSWFCPGWLVDDNWTPAWKAS